MQRIRMQSLHYLAIKFDSLLMFMKNEQMEDTNGHKTISMFDFNKCYWISHILLITFLWSIDFLWLNTFCVGRADIFMLRILCAHFSPQMHNCTSVNARRLAGSAPSLSDSSFYEMQLASPTCPVKQILVAIILKTIISMLFFGEKIEYQIILYL